MNFIFIILILVIIILLTVLLLCKCIKKESFINKRFGSGYSRFRQDVSHRLGPNDSSTILSNIKV